jgi:hypothetical protein
VTVGIRTGGLPALQQGGGEAPVADLFEWYVGEVGDGDDGGRCLLESGEQAEQRREVSDVLAWLVFLQ